MKILHVTPTYFADASVVGGGERYVNNLCKALENQVAVTRSDILSFGSERRDGEILPKSTLRVLPRSGHGIEAAEAIAESGLREQLMDYDVVHIHQCLSSLGFFVAAHARLAGKRVIGTDHGGQMCDLPRLQSFVYSNFDFIHAQSEFSGSLYLGAPVPVRIIKGPVDDEAFALAPDSGRDARKFIALGRILPHKGFENLIDALPEGCILSIIGRIYDRAYFDFLSRRPCKGRVEFLSSLDDDGLLSAIRRAGLCLHGSVSIDYKNVLYLKSELLGLAPLECMATGMPVICSQTAALHELGQLNGCRTYQTTDALAVLLRDFLSGALRFPSGKDIRESVQASYGLEQFGRRYVAAISG